MKLSIWITAAVFVMGGAVAFAAAFTPGARAYNALPTGLSRWIGNTALSGLCDEKQAAFLRGYARTWSAGYLASFRGKSAPLQDIFFDSTLAKCSANRQVVNDKSRAQLDAAILHHGTDDELVAYLRAEPSTGTLLCADKVKRERDISAICAKVFPGAGFAQPAPIVIAPAVVKTETISAPSRKPPPPKDASKPKPHPKTTPKTNSSPA